MMALKPTDSINITEDPADSSNACIEARLHPCSVIAVRESWRVGEFGADGGRGQDLRIWGEDQDEEIKSAPEIDDTFKCKPRNGLQKLKDRDDGLFHTYAPPCPERETIYSTSQFVSGEAPAGAAGDYTVANLSTVIEACCYPKYVEAYIDVCDWRFEPSTPRIVSAFASWDITNLDGENTDIDQSDRKDLFYGGDGGSTIRPVECFTIPAHSKYDFDATLGLKYEKDIIDGFTNRIGSARWVIKTVEDVKLDGLVEEGC